MQVSWDYFLEGALVDRLAHSNLVETHWEERSSQDADASALAQGKAETSSKGPTHTERVMRRRPKLWAVGGGKGGVGKSLISANFAISLARRGRNVLVVDLDIGGANLHTCLGLAPPPVGIGDWAMGRVQDLREVMVSTGEARLRMISGAPDPLKIIGMIEKRREPLLEGLFALDFDDIILDLGAGTSDLTIDFFVAADQGIISILPEPTSVENAYRFIRAALFRKLRAADVPAGIREVIDAAMDQKNVLGIRTPADLLAIVERLDAEAGARLREAILQLSPSIVINQVRSQVDTDVGRAICSVCRRYFGINVRYAGYLDYDNAVWKAVRQKKSVLNEYPHSVLANRLEHLTRTLLGEEEGIV